MDKKEDIENLRKILLAQNVLLDRILLGQSNLHEAVQKRDWLLVERTIAQIDGASAQFLEVDKQRDAKNYSSQMYKSDEVRGVLQTVRSKLIKSKIHNNAMSAYLKSVTDFIKGMLEGANPQKKNKIYGSNGQIVKRPLPSLVLNGLY